MDSIQNLARFLNQKCEVFFYSILTFSFVLSGRHKIRTLPDQAFLCSMLVSTDSVPHKLNPLGCCSLLCWLHQDGLSIWVFPSALGNSVLDPPAADSFHMFDVAVWWVLLSHFQILGWTRRVGFWFFLSSSGAFRIMCILNEVLQTHS